MTTKPITSLDDLNNWIEENTLQNDLKEWLEEQVGYNPFDPGTELLETSSVTIEIEGRKFILALTVTEETT